MTRVTELACLGDRAKELEALKVREELAQKQLAAAEKKVKAGLVEKAELEGWLKAAEMKETDREELVGLLYEYLNSVTRVEATGSTGLCEAFLYQEYLQKHSDAPEVRMVIQVMEDFMTRVQTMLDNVKEAGGQFQKLYELIPPKSPITYYHAEGNDVDPVMQETGTTATDWAAVGAEAAAGYVQNLGGSPVPPPGFEKVSITRSRPGTGSQTGSGSGPADVVAGEPAIAAQELKIVPYVTPQTGPGSSPGIDLRTGGRTGSEPDVLVVQHVEDMAVEGNSQHATPPRADRVG